MDAPSRRSLLRASVPVVAAFAGCAAFDSTSESSPTDSSPTDTPPSGSPTSTPSPLPERSDLSHSGEVLSQTTDTAPARVELRMTNESDHAVYPLPEAESSLLASVPRATGDTGELVCFPPEDDSLHAFGLSGQPVDGCWRFETVDGEEIHVAVNAIARATTRFGPGETDSAVHDVYYAGPDDACFPAGVYEMANSLRFGRKEGQYPGESDLTSVALSYRFEARADGTLSVEAVESG